MGLMDIAFPNLGIYLKDVPKTISVFGFQIAFYGMIIAIGVLLGFTMASREGDRLGHPKDFWWDFSIPAIVFSVIGARIYYVAFSWDMYKGNLKEIFNIRHGGLAIYGAVIAGFLTSYIFCRIKKVSYLSAVDAAVFGLLVGQIIGRWGNFMNREAFGGYTNGLFAMRLPIEAVRQSDISADIAAHIVEGTNYIQVHPTFLYESLWNLALLLLLLAFFNKRRFEGEVFLWYLAGYGIGRFWIESLRTDQLLMPVIGYPVSMAVAAILTAVAVVWIIIGRKRSKRN